MPAQIETLPSRSQSGSSRAPRAQRALPLIKTGVYRGVASVRPDAAEWLTDKSSPVARAVARDRATSRSSRHSTSSKVLASSVRGVVIGS
jgi:hypothetical protein